MDKGGSAEYDWMRNRLWQNNNLAVVSTAVAGVVLAVPADVGGLRRAAHDSLVGVRICAM